MPTGHTPRQIRAMLTMLVAVALFAMMDAALKQLSAHYPPFQVASLRGAASLPLVLAWALATVGVAPLLKVRWSLHLLRGVLGVAMMAAFVYAVNADAAVDHLLDLLRRAADHHRDVGAVPRREGRAAPLDRDCASA